MSVWISVPECCLDVSARVWCGRYVTFSVGFELPRYSFTEGDISEFSYRRYIIPSAVISRPRYPTVLSVHPIFLESPVREHSHAGCLVALGPVLRRRRTYDGCFERCAPAVPQHDRPRASTIPLPAHSPCTAASEQSPAAIDPCGDVGCLAGFRQEGSPPYMPCMRYSIKGDTKNWNSLTRYMIRADLDCVFGKS